MAVRGRGPSCDPDPASGGPCPAGRSRGTPGRTCEHLATWQILDPEDPGFGRMGTFTRYAGVGETPPDAAEWAGRVSKGGGSISAPAARFASNYTTP